MNRQLLSIPKWVQDEIAVAKQRTAEREAAIAAVPCWRRRPTQRRLTPGTFGWDRDDPDQRIVVVECLCDDFTYPPNQYLVARLYDPGDLVVRGRAEIEVEHD